MERGELHYLPQPLQPVHALQALSALWDSAPQLQEQPPGQPIHF